MRLKKSFAGALAAIFALLVVGDFAVAQQPAANPDDVKKMEAALPDSAPAKPIKAHKVLVFGRTGLGGKSGKGFVHKSIPLGCETVKELGAKTGAFEATISYDPNLFSADGLKEFDGIVLVSTTHDFLDDAENPKAEEARKKALLDFVRNGKGLVGIHAAGDAYYTWPQYGQMMGAYFTRHKTGQEKVAVVNEDPGNPINASFEGKGFDFADEIYRFLPQTKFPDMTKQSFSRENVHVLLSIDPTKNNNEPAGTDMPVAWIHQFGRGHVFYCSLGHNEYVYANPTILKYYLAGIQYALGDLKADDKPQQSTHAKAADIQKMEAALPDKAPAQPAKPRKVLAFGRAQGFVHSSIPLGLQTVESLGKKTGAYDTVISFDPSIFTSEKLKEFDAVVLVSTTGNFLDDPSDSTATQTRRNALMQFVRDGKGVAGIHAAGDAYYNWPEYGEMIGGYFNGHPWQRVTVKIDDPSNPITAPFKGQEFQIQDETYTYKKEPWSRDKLHVLMSIDVSKMSDADRAKENRPYDHDYGLSWIHRFGQGRVFYAAHGHGEYIYADKPMLEHYLAGIQYAIGDLKADDAPSAKGH